MRRVLAAALVAPLLVLPAASSASAACAQVPDDFNGDGYSDLAVGAPYRYDPVSGTPAQGALNIAYGSAAGLAKGTAASVTITGRTPGLPVNRFSGSVQLAEALASGYFDGDCYADLAVSGAGNGTFLLLYGSSAGLTSARSAAVDRATIQPGAEDDLSSFSLDLAAGDFNGDGFDDIAAGAPGVEETSGAFGVVYGSVTGITGTGGQWITQDSPGVPGTAERGDVFGRTLAAGDFNGDGRDDLAVGAPGEGIGSRYAAGGVTVFRGTAAGLATKGSTWWDQNSPGVPDTAERFDYFGDALTAGDTNGDRRAELIVAASGEGIGTKQAAGMVHVFRGAASGLVAGPAFDQDNAAIPGAAEPRDLFGSDVTLADLNRDGKRDLVVGVHGETAGSVTESGAINVLYSTSSGPSATGSVYIDQNSSGVPDANEDYDTFGWSLSRLQNAYGGEALVVGAPHEKVMYQSEGAVTVLPGAVRGTPRPAGYFFSEANFPGGAATASNFGIGLP